MNTAILTTAALLLIGCAGMMPDPVETPMMDDLYIGTYTHGLEVAGTPPGIYQAKFDAGSNRLSGLEVIAHQAAPSFLTLTTDRRHLYAVSELWGSGEVQGEVHAYRVMENSQLERINSLSSAGQSPCHIALDQTESRVFTANYGDGIVSVYRRQQDGSLKPDTVLSLEHLGGEMGPRAHGCFIPSDNGFLYVPDLGQDRIWIYALEPASGSVHGGIPRYIQLPEKSGPRHMVFLEEWETACVVNEYGNSVMRMSRDSDSGDLELLQTISTLPEQFEGKSYCADIHLTSTEDYLFASNRGHNSVAVFRVDPMDGSLTRIQIQPTGGDWPRNFTLSPGESHILVAHERSNDIRVFKLDRAIGQLSPTDFKLDIHKPVCLVFTSKD